MKEVLVICIFRKHNSFLGGNKKKCAPNIPSYLLHVAISYKEWTINGYLTYLCTLMYDFFHACRAILIALIVYLPLDSEIHQYKLHVHI